MAFDTAGGEPLGVRVIHTGGWKQYHLYRRVPANGKVAVTFALTGIGRALVDDVKIEPLVPYTAVQAVGHVEPGASATGVRAPSRR